MNQNAIEIKTYCKENVTEWLHVFVGVPKQPVTVKLCSFSKDIEIIIDAQLHCLPMKGFHFCGGLNSGFSHRRLLFALTIFPCVIIITQCRRPMTLCHASIPPHSRLCVVCRLKLCLNKSVWINNWMYSLMFQYRSEPYLFERWLKKSYYSFHNATLH